MSEEIGATSDGDATNELTEGQAADETSIFSQASDKTVDGNETQEIIDSHEETLSLSDFSGMLDVDEKYLDLNDDGKLVFNTDVNGVKGKANLSELVKGHQLESHLNSKSMEVSELKKTLQTKVEDHKTQVAERMGLLDDLTKVMQQELLSDYEGINWKELEQEDSSEYVLQQTKFQARKQGIVDLLQKVQSEKDKVSEADKTVAVNNAVEEKEKLLGAIPTWSDEKIAVKEYSDMSKHAVELGFTSKNFNDITDHKALVMIRESMLYRQLLNKKESIVKKVKSSPKLVKSGSSSSTNTADTPIEDVFYGSS